MKNCSIFLLLLFSIQSYAQIEEETIPTIIKIPASMLIGEFFTQSAGFGIEVEKQLYRKNSISLGLGYLFNTSGQSWLRSEVDQLNGVRISSDIRSYLGNKSIFKKGFFLSLDWDHIFTYSNIKTWNHNLPTKEKIKRYRTTSHLNIGVNSFTQAFKNGRRISFELLLGIGLGYINASSNLEGQEFVKGINEEINYNNGVGFYRAINFDVKLGFTL